MQKNVKEEIEIPSMLLGIEHCFVCLREAEWREIRLGSSPTWILLPFAYGPLYSGAPDKQTAAEVLLCIRQAMEHKA